MARIDAVFARDIAEAEKADSRDLSPEPGRLSRIMERYFFSQLSRS